MLTRVHDHQVAFVHDLGDLWLGVDCMQAHLVACGLVHTNDNAVAAIQVHSVDEAGDAYLLVHEA
jgi:hypothetical protein